MLSCDPRPVILCTHAGCGAWQAAISRIHEKQDKNQLMRLQYNSDRDFARAGNDDGDGAGSGTGHVRMDGDSAVETAVDSDGQRFRNSYRAPEPPGGATGNPLIEMTDVGQDS